MEAQELVGRRLLDREGGSVGKVGQVYLDDQTDEPKWITVRTGIFGTQESFVPLQDAWTSGEDLVVPFDKQTIKDAPHFEVDEHISVEEEQQVYQHYGMQPEVPQQRTESRQEAFTEPGEESGISEERGDPQGRHAMGRGEAGLAATGTAAGMETGRAAGMDAGTETGRAAEEHAGSEDEEASMTLSEEQVHIGVERREAGRARIRKYVDTEEYDESVPVTKERVHVEREPITDAERANGEPRIEESEEEFIVHEERPVVSTESVPVERVRVTREETEEESHVHGERRTERLEVDQDEEEPPSGRA